MIQKISKGQSASLKVMHVLVNSVVEGIGMWLKFMFIESCFHYQTG